MNAISFAILHKLDKWTMDILHSPVLLIQDTMLFYPLGSAINYLFDYKDLLLKP
jgi:hypothetical protein